MSMLNFSGFMQTQATIDNKGVRSSTSLAYLFPVLDRPNLDVVVNAHTTKVRILYCQNCVSDCLALYLVMLYFRRSYKKINIAYAVILNSILEEVIQGVPLNAEPDKLRHI